MQIGSVSTSSSYAAGQAESGAASDEFKAATAFANVLANAFNGGAKQRPEMKGPEAASAVERSRQPEPKQDHDRRAENRPERQAADVGEKQPADKPKQKEIHKSDNAAQQASDVAPKEEGAAQSAAPAESQAAEAAAQAGEEPAQDEAEGKDKQAAEAAIDPNLILNLFIPAAQAAVSAQAGTASQNGTQTGAQAGVAVDANQGAANPVDAALQQIQASVLSPEAQSQIVDAMRQAQGGSGKGKIEVQTSADGVAPKPLVDPAALFADMLAQQGAEGETLDGQGLPGAEQQLLKQDALAQLNSAQVVFSLETPPASSPAADAAKNGLGAVAGLGQGQASQQGQAVNQAQAQAARHASALVPPGEQVAVHVKKAIAEGSDTISIKLDPGNLGRVEVTLEVSQDGRLLAVIAADKPETLQMLQKDAAALEQSLRDGGLKTNQDSLSFQLRDQGQDNRGFAGNEGGGRRGYGRGGDEYGDAGVTGGDMRSLAAAADAQRAAARGGLDIRI